LDLIVGFDHLLAFFDLLFGAAVFNFQWSHKKFLSFFRKILRNPRKIIFSEIFSEKDKNSGNFLGFKAKISAFFSRKTHFQKLLCPRIFSLSSPGQFPLSSHSSLSFSFFSISFSFCFPLFRKGIGKELEIFFFLFSSKKGKRGGKRRRNVKKN
jgi:hypothetical protein